MVIRSITTTAIVSPVVNSYSDDQYRKGGEPAKAILRLLPEHPEVLQEDFKVSQSYIEIAATPN